MEHSQTVGRGAFTEQSANTRHFFYASAHRTQPALFITAALGSLETQMNFTTALGSLDDILIRVIIPLVNKYSILDGFNGV